MSVWTSDGWKRNAPAVILVIGAFVIMAMLASSRWANDAAPIRSVDAIEGTVKSAQWGRGNHIDYVVSLHDGSSVLIEDTRLHVLGSQVAVERVTRDNDFVFYRFPE